MKQCPHCHKMLPDDSAFCSYCGYGLETSQNNKNKKTGSEKLKPNPHKNVWDKVGVLLFVTGLFVFDFVLGAISGNHVKTIYTISFVIYMIAIGCGILSLRTDKRDEKKGFMPAGNKNFAYVAIFSSLFVGLANLTQILMK